MLTTTVVDLRELLAEVDAATKLLQRSRTVPDDVASVIDGVGVALDAAHVQQEADPYLTAALWKAAYRAEKALRDEDRAAAARRPYRARTVPAGAARYHRRSSLFR